MIIPLHYLPKFYDKVTTESFHNVRVSLIVMTVDCLRLFTQSAQLIGLLWLELARDDSPAFTEQNSLAVCQKFWSARQKNYSAEWPLSFFAGLTEFKLAVAVKGSPKFSLQVRWECKICQTHSKVILLSLLQHYQYYVTWRWTKFDRTREKMSLRHVLLYIFRIFMAKTTLIMLNLV